MLAKAPAATAAIITLADKDTVRTSLSLPDGTTTTTSSLARISSQTLVSKVEQLRDELRDPRSDPLPLLAFFYDLLIRPIEPKLRSERIGNLLVSLDGPLRFLPVSALFDRATKKFLFQIYACSNYFAGDIQTLGRQIIPHPTAVCFGATKPVRVGAEQIDPLTSTTEELDAFVQAFGGTRYVDERFTRPTFAQTLREPPTYLEIAAHFQTYPESAIDSFLNLGDGKQFVVHELDDFAPNALAPTDMVVLACCDSGAPARMETYPDEVESFAWKAKKLGARTVISTLWSVGDLSTGYLMARFYRELHQHPEAGKLEALRKAQCWLMSLRERDLGAGYTGDRRPFSHPYFWAPLVLTGNPY
jgi:CHAT domain-containing protein